MARFDQMYRYEISNISQINNQKYNYISTNLNIFNLFKYIYLSLSLFLPSRLDRTLLNLTFPTLSLFLQC